MVTGLRNRPEVKLDTKPRLADFAVWATACEPAFTEKTGAVMGAYHDNVLEAVDSVIESDIVAVALLSFLEAHNNEFAGQTKDLLAKIGIFADEGAKRERSWPRNPQSLSNRLRLATPALRKCGVTIERRKSNGRRLIVITRTTKG